MSESELTEKDHIQQLAAEVTLLRQIVAFLTVYGLPDDLRGSIEHDLQIMEAGVGSEALTPLQQAAKVFREEIAANLRVIRPSMK